MTMKISVLEHFILKKPNQKDVVCQFLKNVGVHGLPKNAGAGANDQTIFWKLSTSQRKWIHTNRITQKGPQTIRRPILLLF